MEAVTVNQEQELINKAMSGDRGAFDQIFTNVRSRLENFVRSLMGPGLRQRCDPEDVLQETFLRAYRSISQFQWHGEESFRRWLEGIAGHLVTDAARNRVRRKELQIVREPVATGVSPSKHLRREERFSRLRNSIRSMSPDYQTVIVLSRIEGLTIKEIAERMKRSESAVKVLVFRAMRELKKSFGDTESLHLGSQTLGNQGSGNEA
jgi:RNA polymerase sigma-70 factor (ECF subfamily)